ncbi:hypothetical protein CWS02_07305 [Enterobacter sp. EA-1]|nr:hypothetical protein CWS02_07305 [Enterobacter sp. EA-1]
MAAHPDAQKPVTLAADQDPAQIRQRCSIADIYFIQNNEHEIQQVILPVSGKGAKSMMHAFLALESDGRTVKNLLYYDQDETPGTGREGGRCRLAAPVAGQKVLDDRAQPALKVVQQNSGNNDNYTVDGITGATMTSVGVEKSINFWTGARGYGHFLQRLMKDKKILSNQ